VSSTSVFVGPLETVNPGDLIGGYSYVFADGLSALADDLSTSASSGIVIGSSGGHWTIALAGVLEVYGVNSCSLLPSSGYTQFFNSEVYDGYPSYNLISPVWQGEVIAATAPNGCSFKVVAPSEGSTATLHY
jgi:hypothetical protein